MMEADLFDTSMQGSDLAFCDLQGANLSLASLQGAELRNAQMEGVELAKANLQVANLIGANLHGSLLDKNSVQGALFKEKYYIFARLGHLSMFDETPPRWDELQKIADLIQDPEWRKQYLERVDAAKDAIIAEQVENSFIYDPNKLAMMAVALSCLRLLNRLRFRANHEYNRLNSGCNNGHRKGAANPSNPTAE